ncbi:SDR family NAD(P)-dependent oxidoreductase [Acinetobacter nectaris]|uniref:SDR family NAD(P)-dependent oxidoreductase n=1 Tax=Acinetobacter nectaris TaxID=1219382 RepID=UPI001F159ADD|nr:SDR family NAD(P)-dependent oxidoreductase [Acinetobacter nectaris]MCF9047202.1 SDR family NAD(P)-dependent oxidoreductase [Acinetobacter nectaris]
MILITGGLGFIGSHLALYLLKQGKEVVLVDNLVNSNVHMLERLQYLAGRYIPFFDGDLRNTPALNKFIEQYAIEMVVHCAGFKSVAESYLKPIEYYNNNLSSLISLIRAMQRAGIRKLICISSLMVYGQSELNLFEQTTFNYETTNPYIKSQQMMERILRDVVATDAEWKMMLLRVSNVAGAFEDGFLGEFIATVPKSIFGFMLQTAKHERSHIDLYLNRTTNDYSDERSFIHILDVCKAISQSIQWLNLNMDYHILETLNIAHDQTHSILDLIHTAEKIIQTKIPIISHQPDLNLYSDNGIAQLGANSQKAKTILDWHTQYNLDEMIRHQWKFYTG